VSLVTRGLGGANLVTRGYGDSLSTIPRVYPLHIDSRPLLFPPEILLTAVDLGIPVIIVPVTVHSPRIAIGVTVPLLAVGTAVLQPTLIGTIGIPTIVVPVALYPPNLSVATLDYIYMTLGIAQMVGRLTGIAQSTMVALGIRQVQADAVRIETVPAVAVVTDTVIGFDMGIKVGTQIPVGIRQQVGIYATVTQDVEELLTQTLDY
jgi:hypothetical protein